MNRKRLEKNIRAQEHRQKSEQNDAELRKMSYSKWVLRQLRVCQEQL